MIEINLLPDEMKKKLRSKSRLMDLSAINFSSVLLFKVAAGVVVLIISLHLLLLLMGIHFASSFKAISKKQSSLAVEKKDVATLKSNLEGMRKRLNAINELMVKRFSWARQLNAISDSMTPGVWLSELKYEQSVVDRIVKSQDQGIKTGAKSAKSAGKKSVEKVVNRYLVISGYASSMGEQGTALVAKFIKSLKDNYDFYSSFSDIDLDSIKSYKLDSQEVMSFKITCLFKEATR